MGEPGSHRKEIPRFLVAGVVNTGLTYAIYLLFQIVIGYQAAYAIAYVAGIAISYHLNSRYVFQVAGSWKTFVRYPLVYVAQYLAGAGLLEILVRWWKVPPSVAPLFVLVLTVPMTFVLSKTILRGGGQRT